MTTQDYNKASDRLQAFSRIARAEMQKQYLKNMAVDLNFSSSYLGWMQFNRIMNKVQDALYKASGL